MLYMVPCIVFDGKNIKTSGILTAWTLRGIFDTFVTGIDNKSHR